MKKDRKEQRNAQSIFEQYKTKRATYNVDSRVAITTTVIVAEVIHRFFKVIPNLANEVRISNNCYLSTKRRGSRHPSINMHNYGSSDMLE